MYIAIYSRKSKFTGRGESIENQISLCIQYAKSHFDTTDENIIVYEDEGYSGSSIERPMFKKMMEDANANKFQIIICYRLDRISRNINDFSQMIEMFSKLKISFVSIREQFDTTTPMGRAMMYIASVFSQLERETIAERIRDNMLELAKTGRWLGGITPLGFESIENSKITENTKSKKSFALHEIEIEIKMVKAIYEKFLSLKSLTKLETFLLISNAKTKNNKNFSRFGLKGILSNPVYATADENLYLYFEKNGYDVFSDKEDFKGLNGIMAYNKTDQIKKKANKLRNPSEWIIAIGNHKGVISSEDWVHAQNILQKNNSKSYRKIKSSKSILSGILRCGHCGSYMRPKAINRQIENNQVFYYLCELKEKSKGNNCKMKNINGNDIDELVTKKIIELVKTHCITNKNFMVCKKKSLQDSFVQEDTISLTEQKIKSNERHIKNLVHTLSDLTDNDSAKEFILKQISELSEDNNKLEKELVKTTPSLNDNDIKFLTQSLSSFSCILKNINIIKRQNFIKQIIKKIYINEETCVIELF